MERRTQAQARAEKFSRRGQELRDLADLAMRDIDETLALYGTPPAPTRPPALSPPQPHNQPDPPEAG